MDVIVEVLWVWLRVKVMMRMKLRVMVRGMYIHASSHACTYSRAGMCHLVAGRADQAVAKFSVATPT